MKSDPQLQSEIQAEIPEIDVRPAGATPTDAEIANAVATLLAWSSELDAKDVHTRVEGSWVTLEGSVSRPAERRAAERLAGQIRGASGVSNRIRVDGPMAEPAPVHAPAAEEATGWRPVDEEC